MTHHSGWRLLLLCILLTLCTDGAPPNRDTADDLQSADKQRRQEQEQREREEQQKKEIAKYVKYMGYLETVLTILQATPQWKEAMQSMTQEEMRGGKIAEMVDKLDPHIVEQLAKAKLLELQRLEQEIKDQMNADGGSTHNIKVPEHVDFNNWGAFSREDLRKLIIKTVADMDDLERQRKQGFKEYEMKKKAEQDHRMAQMTELERARYLQQMEEQRRRHNEHERLKHPGSRDQLEEAWQNTDQLDKDAYDPRTFFSLHDIDNDGYWSLEELNTIFQSELDKLYNASDPDDDPNERREEMYRMREHVLKQMDKNNDRRISLAEFLADAEAQDDKPDEGWEDIADNEQYTKEELEKFEKEYAKQQGWGDFAYSTPVPSTVQPYQPGRLPAHQYGQMPAEQNAGIPPRQPDSVAVQQLGEVPLQQMEVSQPSEQQQQQQLQQQEEHQQVDKTYGV